jgi:hypothetical protein
MIISGIWAMASYRRMTGITMDGRKRRDRKAARAAAANGGLMDRIEERWRRRQEGNNR